MLLLGIPNASHAQTCSTFIAFSYFNSAPWIIDSEASNHIT
jgi:hypothetical protein